MADAANDQIAYWNGEVGQRWARNQRALDAAFAPLPAALIDRAALRVGARILDVGCGAGETALIATNRIGPRGDIVACDVSAPLLDVARGRVEREAAGGASIDWTEADAATHAFGAASFEHILSRFGVMFFADSEAAFAHLRYALVPGGRMTFLCWRSLDANPWVSVPRAAVLPLVPDYVPPPADGPGPFRFADRADLEKILRLAGFKDVVCEPVDRGLTLARSADGSAAAATAAATRFVLELGPVSRLVRDGDPRLKAEAFTAVREVLRGHVEMGAVTLGAACWLVSAAR